MGLDVLAHSQPPVAGSLSSLTWITSGLTLPAARACSTNAVGLEPETINSPLSNTTHCPRYSRRCSSNQFNSRARSTGGSLVLRTAGSVFSDILLPLQQHVR